MDSEAEKVLAPLVLLEIFVEHGPSPGRQWIAVCWVQQALSSKPASFNLDLAILKSGKLFICADLGDLHTVFQLEHLLFICAGLGDLHTIHLNSIHILGVYLGDSYTVNVEKKKKKRFFSSSVFAHQS